MKENRRVLLNLLILIFFSTAIDSCSLGNIGKSRHSKEKENFCSNVLFYSKRERPCFLSIGVKSKTTNLEMQVVVENITFFNILGGYQDSIYNRVYNSLLSETALKISEREFNELIIYKINDELPSNFTLNQKSNSILNKYFYKSGFLKKNYSVNDSTIFSYPKEIKLITKILFKNYILIMIDDFSGELYFSKEAQKNNLE
jgi:hypothetical protein